MHAEAIAMSRLGKVYDTILKDEDKAKYYFRKAVHLAQSLTPRNFTKDGKIIMYFYAEIFTFYKRAVVKCNKFHLFG